MERQLLLLRQGNGQFADEVVNQARLKQTSRRQRTGKQLSDKGKRRAQRMGVWLSRRQLQPELVFSSASPLARVTAEKSVKAMGVGTQRITCADVPDKKSHDQWLKLLSDLPYKTSRVMVVAGKKQVNGLIRHFTPTGKLKKSMLKPASLAVFSFSDSWHNVANASTQTSEIIHAKSLPDGFPYPNHDSNELRIRPAYYYRQSSVIPYRIENGAIQVLLVSSSKMKHWVVPKGIHEPGLSSKESAAKEALEEAGVEGAIGTEALGHYTYQKWEASCRVVVYPMLVKRIIPEDRWAEAHRGRRWCSPQEAAQMVRQRELAPLIEKLATRADS